MGEVSSLFPMSPEELKRLKQSETWNTCFKMHLSCLRAHSKLVFEAGEKFDKALGGGLFVKAYRLFARKVHTFPLHALVSMWTVVVEEGAQDLEGAKIKLEMKAKLEEKADLCARKKCGHRG